MLRLVYRRGVCTVRARIIRMHRTTCSHCQSRPDAAAGPAQYECNARRTQIFRGGEPTTMFYGIIITVVGTDVLDVCVQTISL
jgi:hypothetical protein